jgi:proline iminopeptidase
MNPDEHTIQETFLEVGDGHTLYIHEWGNPNAKVPVIFLHGGPGAGCGDGHKDHFEPAKQRVVFFDQRGAGKSLPSGSLNHNTTQNLIDDINKIADHLKLDKFILTGGSWGSCLALAYGLQHPKRVEAMVLRGIYTGSREENDFIDNGGFKAFFPDVWDAYLSRTPKEFHADPSAFHYRQLESGKPSDIKSSAYAYSEMEGSLLSIDDRHTPDNFEDFDPNGMAIELHYLGNGCFMPDRHIFKSAKKLTMPIWLVQGRYDAVCPPVTAYELNKVLPDSELIMVTAGHTGKDRAIVDVIKTLLLQLTK